MTVNERLEELSAEHRLAQNLVLRIRDELRRGMLDEQLFSTIVRRFDQELDRHFASEEAILVPNLVSGVGCDLASRLVAEHQMLRALMGDIRKGEVAALRAFADVLDAHVRFEERELYPACKSLLADRI